METVFLLTRGKRLSNLFLNIGKELSRTHKVIVFCTQTKADRGSFDETALWQGLPNVEVHKAYEGIEAHYQKIKASGKEAEFLEKIERELSLTLFKAASNYLLYRRFHEEYFSYWDGYCNDLVEVKEEYIGTYSYFSENYDRYRPSLVFSEAPDLISLRVASALANRRGIFAVGHHFVACYEKGRVFLNAGTNRRNILLDHYYSHPEKLSELSLQEAEKTISKYNKGEQKDAHFIRDFRKKTKSPLVSRIKLNADQLNFKTMPSKFKRAVRLIQNSRWLESHMHKELPKEPYLFFPLHHQPEAATNLVAPRWVDQEKICEQLALNAPFGIKIVLKENPRTYSLRGKKYFNHLAKLPNVHLLHPAFDQYTAFRKAEAVLTIAGTAGIEGIFMRKKVGVLGETYFSDAPGIKRLKYPEEIFDCMNDPDWAPENVDKDRKNYLAAYIQSSFFVGEGSKGSAWPEPVEGGKRYGEGIRAFLAEIKRFQLKPESFNLIS